MKATSLLRPTDLGSADLLPSTQRRERPRALASLPDVASHQPSTARGRIDRVGMERIELPIRVRDESGQLTRVPAQADVFVSLDREDAKGIHMSRLFLALQEVLGKDEIGVPTLERLLAILLSSHSDLSRSAEVIVRFDMLVERDSLESGHRGWMSYPITWRSRLHDNVFRHELATEITYSSTCPCSAALSRQLASEKFLATFSSDDSIGRGEIAEWIASEEGMPATPHSQRSFAELLLVLDAAETGESLGILRLLDVVEGALGTPVQSAVKREDEQAFAALNGANLMFCEDAARRIRAEIETAGGIADYRINVRHEESLHPHDAVATLVKGVEGGLRA